MASLFSSDEPFGLPSGTVRGVIALVSVALVAYSYVTQGTIDSTLLAFSGPYLGFYFGARGTTTSSPPPEPVGAPYITGEIN